MGNPPPQKNFFYFFQFHIFYCLGTSKSQKSLDWIGQFSEKSIRQAIVFVHPWIPWKEGFFLTTIRFVSFVSQMGHQNGGIRKYIYYSSQPLGGSRTAISRKLSPSWNKNKFTKLSQLTWETTWLMSAIYLLMSEFQKVLDRVPLKSECSPSTASLLAGIWKSVWCLIIWADRG